MAASATRKRKEWIDVLRAVAMLFVIYGHLLAGHDHQNFYLITSPIKIPLFFAISGYVFNTRDGDLRAFLKNLWKKLVIPFLFFTAVLLPVKAFAAWKGLIDHSAREVLISFVTGNEIWYLPCCIVAEFLFFLVLRSCKKEVERVALCAVLAAVGFALGKIGILSVANFNTAFIAQVFLLIGFLFRQHEKELVKRGRILVPIGLAVYAALCIVYVLVFPRDYIDVHRNQYLHLPLDLLMILVGNFTVLEMASLASVRCGPIEFIGRNTITYYVIHEYVIGAIGVVTSKALHIGRGAYLTELAFLLLVCVICAMISLLIDRFLPFAVGKKRQHLLGETNGGTRPDYLFARRERRRETARGENGEK